MSRSKKKTPVCGMTRACSEKQDKRFYNRRYRRACNQSLHMNPAREAVPPLREYSNPAAMAKDGKVRFDPRRFPRLMRK